MFGYYTHKFQLFQFIIESVATGSDQLPHQPTHKNDLKKNYHPHPHLFQKSHHHPPEESERARASAQETSLSTASNFLRRFSAHFATRKYHTNTTITITIATRQEHGLSSLHFSPFFGVVDVSHPRNEQQCSAVCNFHEDPQNRMELIKGNIGWTGRLVMGHEMRENAMDGWRLIILFVCEWVCGCYWLLMGKGEILVHRKQEFGLLQKWPTGRGVTFVEVIQWNGGKKCNCRCPEF